MKRFQYLGCIAVAAALTLSSCSDDFVNPSGSKASGRISPSVDVNSSVLSAVEARSRAEVSTVTAADLSITLTAADGSFSQSWASINDFPASQPFAVGTYTMEASYGSEASEGFEMPWFFGSQTFRVREGETTPVAITAELCNAMVAVNYSDAFKKYMTAYSAELHSEGGIYLTYAADETRAAYLKAGNVTVSVDFTKPNGTGAKLQVAKFAAEARHCYNVTVDVNDGAVGEASMVITIDDALTVEPIEIDLSDDILNAPAPEIITDGFSAGDAITTVDGNDFAGDLTMNIIARAGLAEMVLTTQSASLLAQGWPAEVDLLTIDADKKAKIEALGFSALGVFKNPDKMAVLNFAKIIPNIKYVAGESNTFTLAVTDRYGKTSEPVSFKVDVDPITFAINSTEAYLTATELTLNVSYNGDKPTEGIKVMFKNNRGTFTVCPIVSATNNGDGTYDIVCSVPVITGPITITAQAGDVTVSDYVVTPSSAAFSLTADEADIFSSWAALHIICPDGDPELIATQATAEYSVDGGATWQASAPRTVKSRASVDYVIVAGFPADTEVMARASVNDFTTDPITFTSEGTEQLPNAGMEVWSKTKGQTNNWWTEFPYASGESGPWNTRNQQTVSEGGNSTYVFLGMGSYNGCSFSAYSGTRFTTDVHSGEKAAIIETIGWGGSNTKTSCGRVTAGELYLGTMNTTDWTPQYGYDFTKRPAALSFWYKYTAKNSADYGCASIELRDDEGNVIGSGYTKLTAIDEYTEVTVPVSYSIFAKAASISVVFKSSDNASCLNNSSENITYSNDNATPHRGSSLYIDDINLVY